MIVVSCNVVHWPLFFLKLWARREDSAGAGGDGDEIPFDVKINVVGVVDFKNEKTKARCKGWLCLQSTNKLRVDIISPTCDFDGQLTLRTGEWNG